MGNFVDFLGMIIISVIIVIVGCGGKKIMNIFTICVIILFIGAGASEAWHGNWIKSAFFVLSAMINVVVCFMK